VAEKASFELAWERHSCVSIEIGRSSRDGSANCRPVAHKPSLATRRSALEKALVSSDTGAMLGV
jgi:hypothetical protein